MAEIHKNEMKYAHIRTVQPWAVYHFVFSVKEPGLPFGAGPFLELHFWTAHEDIGFCSDCMFLFTRTSICSSYKWYKIKSL